MHTNYKSIIPQHENNVNTRMKINGKFGIDLSKIKGNTIEDIFDLSTDPENIRKSLFVDGEPVRISVSSYVNRASYKQVFKFCMWFGHSRAPVIIDMPKKNMTNYERWVRNNLSDYRPMTEAVIEFIVTALGKALPVISSYEVFLQEEDTVDEILEKVISAVRTRQLADDTIGASQFKIVEMTDADGKKAEYACICGSMTMKNLLKEFQSPYNEKKFLDYLDNWYGGSLLKKNGVRKDYKFKSSDAKRWYCIKIIDE